MFKIIAAAALAATSFAASAGNLVQDGSFESTLVADGQWTTVASTATVTGGSTTAWTSTNGIEIRNDIAGQTLAGNGNNFVELDTNANSSISQTLTTVAGTDYKLTFYVQDRAGDAPSTDGLTYTVNGVGGAIAGGVNANWTEYTYYFAATSASTVLTFNAAGTSDGYGSSLDAVSVTAVPEAPSLAMLAAGLGLLGLARRRMQK